VIQKDLYCKIRALRSVGEAKRTNDIEERMQDELGARGGRPDFHMPAGKRVRNMTSKLPCHSIGGHAHSLTAPEMDA
jgi:hypothetical protein